MKHRKLILLLAVVMAFSSVMSVNFGAVSNSSVVAYAASLTAPAVTVKSASYSSAKISWKKIPSAKKYVIYRSLKKSTGFKAVKTIAKNTTVSFTDTKLTCGKTYYYKVAAVKGSTKKLSAVKSVKIVPSAPSSLTITSTKCGVNTVKYSAVSGATGYQVYYSASKSGTYKNLKTTTAKSFAHTVGAGKAGYYKVRAYKTVSGTKVYGPFTAIKNKTAMKHSYSAYYVTVEPTCATAGKKVATCKTCGAKSTASIPADPIFYEHEYTDYVVTKEPTCTQEGVETKTCKLCGKAINKGIAKLGHDYGEYTVTTAPTCEASGVETSSCSRCDSKLTRELSPVGHSWQDIYTVDMQPSCTEAGSRSIHCDNCDAVKDAVKILATGHSYTSEGVANENNTHNRTCVNCGEINPEAEACDFSYTIIKAPTKLEVGKGLYSCKYCSNSYEVELDKVECDHPYAKQTTINALDSSCAEAGYTGDLFCTDCETIIATGESIAPLGHSREAVTVPATCAKQGYTANRCTVCGDDEITAYFPIISHTKTTEYVFNENGEFCYVCEYCKGAIPTSICVINLDNATDINLEGVAYFNEAENKLVLKGTDIVDSFELYGTMNASVTVNAHVDTEVKLCGVDITTNAADCVKINNKAPVNEETGLRPSVTVSISAKDGTVNNLTANTSGNAIESEAKLEFKGHGVLNAKAVSTAINCTAKISIKNITLNIESDNRGIDTKNLVPKLDVNGDPITDVNDNPVMSEEYYNIGIAANAKITIKSNDDGIRCKNMEFEAINADLGEKSSTLTITSEIGDGIQIEGKTGITMNSGDITITAGKRAFNCKQVLFVINTDADGNDLGSYTIIKCSEIFKA